MPLGFLIEDRLRAVLDTVHDGVLVIDERGTILVANPAVARMLGWSVDELSGRNVAALMPEPDRSRHGGYVGRYLATGEARIIGRGRFVDAQHRAGHRVPIELAVSPIRLKERTLFCGTLRDVTAQREAERREAEARAQLHEQNARLEALLAERTRLLDSSDQFMSSALDALTEGVVILDARARVLVTNRAWRHLAGRSGDDGPDIGLAYADAAAMAGVGPDDVEAIAAGMAALLRGDAVEHVVECLAGRPERARWLRIRATRFDCARGTHLVLSHEDVTRTRQAHEDTAASAALLRAVVETAPDHILILDGDDRIEFVGRPSHHVGQPIAALSHPAFEAKVRALCAEARASDATLELDGTGPPSLGLADREFTLRVRRLDLPGKPGRLLLVASDVTERKRAAAALAASQEQLRQVQKMEAVGQLAGGIAHDFNNLITAIRYHASYVIEHLPAGSELTDELVQIDRASERATQLTRQLLAFGRRQTLVPEVVDPNELTAELLPMFRRAVGSRIRVEALFAPEARWVRVDRGQLEQVLTNLVVNARDAIPHTGAITVTTRLETTDDEQLVVLSVEDSGTGMSSEVRERIFEPFFSTKGPASGHGLGLAMVFGIVSQSGGTIDVWSEPGVGTRFDVRLPRVGAPAPTRPRSRSPMPFPGAGESLLLVDDEELVRRALGRLLSEAGYEVVATGDPLAALATLRRPGTRFDLVITDVVMPDMTGTQLVEAMRQTQPDLRALFVSGYAAGALRAADLEAERSTFLAKPFTPQELLAKVREALALPGA